MGGFWREEFVRANTALHLDLIREFKPDVAVDSFGVFACLAARIARVPLATVLPGKFLSGERWLSLVGGRTAGPSAEHHPAHRHGRQRICRLVPSSS